MNVRGLAAKILGEVLDEGKFASSQIDFYLQGNIVNSHFVGANSRSRTDSAFAHRSGLLQQNQFSAPDAALLTELVYGVLRQKLFLDSCLAKLIRLKKNLNFIQHILRLAAYQILFLDRVPDYAAVFESVALAKKSFGQRQGDFVNAVLRNFQKNKASFLAMQQEALALFSATDKLTQKEIMRLSTVCSFPPFLLLRWARHFDAQQLGDWVTYFNRVPPLHVRVNILKTNPKDFAKRLQDEGCQVDQTAHLPTLKLHFKKSSLIKQSLQKGLISIQDINSYQVASSVHLKDKDQFLDVCAGHGGKASAIAERFPSNTIYVHDQNVAKIDELKANFKRLGIKAPKIISSFEDAKSMGLLFDWILVDAPCSGTGTLGRKPEIRWRLQEKDFARMAERQEAIIEQWQDLLRVGGRLVYSVCSIEEEEGEGLVKKIQKKLPHLSLEKMSTNHLSKPEGDGFFYCQWVKGNGKNSV